MGVFKEDNNVIIIAPEIKTIPAFAAIIARDKDRQKRNAKKELAYIYYVTDFMSPYSIYDEEEREVRAQKACGFSDGWRKDAIIKHAIHQYEELQQTPAIKSLKTIRETLFSALNAVKYVRTYLDRTIAHLTSEADDEDGPEMDTESLIKTVNELLKLADKLPTTIATLEQVEEKVKKEQTNKRRIKGGGDANYFED